MCSHCLRASCDFFYGASGGQPGVNPYRDCAEIVRKLCNVSAVAVQSPQPPHGNRTEPVRGIVQCHLRHVYGVRAYDFFKFVKLLAKPNRRGRGARESLRKSYSRLLPPHGGLAEAARKVGYGQDTGSVDPSQAKCELGIISIAFLLPSWNELWQACWTTDFAKYKFYYNVTFSWTLSKYYSEGIVYTSLMSNLYFFLFLFHFYYDGERHI